MDKDLQYYLDHPDETPSPEELALLSTQMATPVVADDAPTPAEKDVKKDNAPSSVEEKKKDVDTQEGDILMPSGKGTIPYSVLKSEREKRQAAESAVAELSTRLAEIQAQLAKGTDKGDAKAEQLGTEALENLNAEELEALRADFPVFGNVIDKLMTTIGSLTGEVETLKKTEHSREVEVRNTIAETVQGNIDNEPILSHLQATDSKLFAKAVEIDNTLTGDPRYPDMAVRFKKVAEIMDSTFGPFDGLKAPPPVDKEVARKTVDQKLAATKATPKSLSDIPTGEMPESDEMTSLENLSAIEISDKLMKMSSDQRTAYLNRF